MVRINFEADEELKARIEWLGAVKGCRTQKQVIERALDVLVTQHRLVHEYCRALVAIRPEHLNTAGMDMLVVDLPPSKKPAWLSMRDGWQATPWVKGTRIHVSDVRAALLAEPDLAVEDVASDFGICLEAAQECVDYIANNEDLLKAEDQETALRIAQGSHDNEAPDRREPSAPVGGSAQ